ncbi:hypothetical protein N7539_009480 [Penicillium diatomitis]|uniref:UFSP1/2/DUB catalytic domain-containing protein n=1 Tax=Penicillium diatomitis TaxID=2819901 RepID=A0A9X0BJG2_9EURO|nr:uncharacterized protein N7539_009480 [Penicillium diatomitis]KAJ5466751.1 hypothetical protein N7539_009480 [Penicillium diatomitis]
MNQPQTLSCPFCSFSDTDASFLQMHIDHCHPENGDWQTPLHSSELNAWEDMGSRSRSPLPRALSEDPAEKYVDCPHGCGETVTTAELSTHLDLHLAEGIAFEDADADSIPVVADDSANSDMYDMPLKHEDQLDLQGALEGGKRGSGRNMARSHNVAKPTRAKSPPRIRGEDGAIRLGRAELGPHAHEKKMPSWLKHMLEKGGRTSKQTHITSDGKLARQTTVENETDKLIPIIAKLCEQDATCQRAFLCNTKVRHICKLSREGGFCGYRNIQMLVSYITKTQAYGHSHFPHGIPSILDLQDMIEQAWDMGFNSTGRTETGGIKGTRKFIGTPEAQALFQSLGIPCDASSIASSETIPAHDQLYMEIANYFRAACPVDDESIKVFQTDLPPIYFQHDGHSMTIVGFEIRDDGTANLLVFDPMFKTSPAVQRLIGASSNSLKSVNASRLLKAYRRGNKYLHKYKLFEILKLIPVPEDTTDKARSK